MTWQPVPEHDLLKNGRTSFWKLTVAGRLQLGLPEAEELEEELLDAVVTELEAPPVLPLVVVVLPAAPPVPPAPLLALVDEAVFPAP